MKRKIKAISFDFWNTLFRDIHGNAYQQNRLKLFLQTVRAHHECCEEKAQAAFNYCSSECHRIWIEEHRTPIARERLQLVLAQLELELQTELLESLSRSCAEMVYQFPPVLIEHVAEVLERLSPAYKLAVISDTGFASGAILRELMSRNGILKYFDVLTFSDEAGRSKPHESIFLATAERLAVHPSEMLHIGDLEFTDVVGACAVGAKAVLFAPDADETLSSGADHIFRSHLELLDLLSQEDQYLNEAAD